MNNQHLIAMLRAGAEQLLPAGSLEKKLAQNRPLTVKFGMDPTAPDLHLGHAVVLSKLKLLQDAGHTIILIIGDFTARIGDPTGRSKTRPPLTEAEIAHNAQTYLAQISKILDPQKLKIVYNSSWLDSMTSRDWIQLCARVTVAQIIEREDFKKRLHDGTPIHLHEILYPLMQGYDSVELKADIELGGSDQTFNLLMGRTLQEQYQLEGQCILTMPLLEGLDGSAKMSKSYGNTIGLTESPDQAFGKLMSISDTLMWRYFRLLLNKTDDEIAQYQSAVAHGTSHPMELKKEMAFAIIKRFWGNNAAHDGLAAFETLFQKKDLSAAKEYRLDDTTPAQMPIIDLMRHVGACDTNSEARRLIAAGAVSIDQEKITDIQTVIDTSTPHTLRVGKHKFYQLIR